MAKTSLDFLLFAILDVFLRPVFNFPGKVPIVARVAFETFLCTSASMGGRGGWRIIDGQNKSRLFFVCHSGRFFLKQVSISLGNS